jgi:signal transduction histidine kinase
MAWSTTRTPPAPRRFPRVLGAVNWLRAHRVVVFAAALAGVATSFALDLVIPGYAIAGLYLIPVILVAFALRVRLAVAVGLACLALTSLVLVLQDRVNGQNILLLVFGALAGVGLIALGSLFDRFDRLYETERSTTARLQFLTAQMQALQEASVLDSDRPLSDLLHHIVVQAQQLLAADSGALFRLDADGERLSAEAASGLPDDQTDLASGLVAFGPVSRAVGEHRPVAVRDLDAVAAPQTGDRPPRRPGDAMGYRACLAVPLVVRQEPYGAVVLYFREPRRFNDEDLSLALAFGDQAALAIENTRLREQMERSAVAAERSRLARDLHDSVTQSLFAAGLQAEALLRRSEPLSPEALRSLEDLQRLTRTALAEMRTLLLELRPTALAESWLGDLLGYLVESSAARSGTEIALSVTGQRALPPDVTIALYRLVQEALSNVVRHARARRAWVTLDCSSGDARLVVGDDGTGFDPSHVRPEQFGLRNMRERAEAAGATLAIDSRSGRGTVVSVEWSDRRG